MGVWNHFKLLLWKNFIIQKRHPIATLVQLLVPIVLVVVLVIIRQETDTISYMMARKYENVDLESCSLGPQFMRPGGSSNGRLRVTYAPTNPTVDSVMKIFAERISMRTKFDILGFETEEELLVFNQLESNKSYDVVSLVFPGVQTLNDLKTGDIAYSIRFPIKQKQFSFMEKQIWYTHLIFPTIQDPGPRNPGSNTGGPPSYCEKGFLSVQHHVAMAIAVVLNGPLQDEVPVSIRRFPYPAYYNDIFIVAIREFLPLIIMISFLYPAFDLVKNLVLEKEKRLKESMKIMGLRGILHWSSWYFKSLILFTISTVFFTFFLCCSFGNTAILIKSDPSVIFVFLMIYVFSGISFCCMLSTFFSKANSAATAAGIIWFLIYFPYFFLQKRYDTMTYWQKILSCLLCNTGMAFGSMQISLYEGSTFGAQWRLLATPSTPDDTFSMFDVFVVLIVDSLIYLLVTWYVDAVFPGEYGMPLHWYFPVQKSYWCKSRDKISHELPPTAEHSSPDVFEEDPVNLKAGVQIQGLTKVFSRSKIAVNNLNLNMYENQITVLLGHNGAGKTTTMSMLTGLFPPTTGQAFINGFEIHTDIESVRNSLGLCPQFNVLFDDLTVEEHLYFACKLKSCPQNKIKKEIDDMLTATNLLDKRNKLSPTLSGGMKRRLCVGMAFVGGSKVVMLDEPTSGMDPAARRFTWELLQSQGKGRTILLTTHFMDEADILGDRIAIMAHGQLQCCGTPMFLKKRFGAGYHLILVKEPGCDVSTLKTLIKGIIPKAQLESNIGAELSFILPHSSSSNFPRLFSQIEERKEQLKISSYGASVTTMEEVFLKVGEQSDATLKHRLQGENDAENGNGKYMQIANNSPGVPSKNGKSDSITLSIEPRVTKFRNRGLSLMSQQFWAMFVKRMLHTRRNWILMLVQLVIPILITVIIMIVVNMAPSQNLAPPLKLNLSPFQYSTVIYSNDSKNKSITSLYASQFAASNDKAVQVDLGAVTMDNYMLMVAGNDSYDYNMHYIIGGTFEQLNGRTSAVAWFNNQPYHAIAISVAAIDTALLRQYTAMPNLKLTVINHPLPETIEDEVTKRKIRAETETKKDNKVTSFMSSTTKAAVKRADDIIKDTMTGFQIAFNIMFGMSFLVSSFIVFLVKEKACDAKHLQFVSGVNSVTFWLSTFAWDFINFIIPCFGVMLVFIIFGQDGYNTFLVQASMLLLFCCYGFCVLPFTYLASFLFSVASTAYARVIMFNIFSGVVTLITVSILSLIDDLHDTAVLLDWLFLALPNYCLAGAMKSLYDNFRGHKYCGGQYPALTAFCTCDKWICLRQTSSYLSWDAPGIGRNLFFLFIWGIVYFLLILLLEIGLGRRFMSFLYSWKLRHLQKKPTSSNGQVNPMMAGTSSDEEDVDVANERARIHGENQRTLISNNTLLMKDLTKYYGLIHPFQAVDRLCVAVPRGECFGLLGINGAGKTSTFKMLTGDEIVSSGDAYVSGYSVRREMKMVRHRLGYCPQFDAVIDQMTGRETLIMFARLRGVPEKEIPTLVQTLSTNLLFSEYIDKLVKNYSGGNKRKLSTAVALVGDPPIIFLDEPTTGIDPMARRFVWDTISKIRDAGSSIILTSHRRLCTPLLILNRLTVSTLTSMEECDALCTRLAIMVNGRFQCLGSAQHLKNKFGKGYTLTAKIHHNAQTAGNMDEMTKNLQKFITKTFPGSTLKDQHHGMVHYQIPSTVMSWANIFGALEKAKVQYHLEDYAIGQTTLEQVFLSFTRKQNDTKDVDG